VATFVFPNNFGRLIARIDSVNISLLSGSDIHSLSLDTFDLGAFIFGSMLDLTTSLSTHSATTIWRHVQVSISLDINYHIRGFVAPPRVMVCFKTFRH
jgi:hypothetical protein